MPKYLLVAQIDTPSPLPNTWDMLADPDRDFRNFFEIALEDSKSARINGFTLARLDGPDQSRAIEACRTVAQDDDIARVLA